MNLGAQLRVWFGAIFRRSQTARELDEELRAHVENRADDLERSGLTRAEAERRARIEFGAHEKFKEECREERGGLWLETVWSDIRFGARMLGKSPGFTAVALLTLALGIGANAAVFSLVNSVLLRPLPYRDASRLVWVSNDMPLQHASLAMESDYFAWRRLNHCFEDVAAYEPGETLTLTGGGEPEQIEAGRATHNLLDVLGITPRLGRSFRPEEDRPGAPRVVLLTDSLWHRRFSSNAAILGRQIALDREPYTVVGILPRGFEFLDNSRAEVIVPSRLEHYEVAIDKPMRLVSVVARLRPGIPPAAGRADVDAINKQLWASYPASFVKMMRGARAQVVPLHDRLVGKVRPALLVLLGAVGFVLLIACVNVANLQLARAVSREKDMAIRGCLGAGHWRLVRQLLTENILIALAGGAGGLLLAAWLITVLRVWGPENVPHLGLARLDMRVLLFAFAASLLTGLLFGLSPSLAVFRVPIAESLRKSGAREGASIKVRRPHSLLMVFELAAALVLFVGAALLIRSFIQLISIPPGFDAQGVLTARISLPLAVYQTQQQKMAFYLELDQRITALPGVDTAGLATVLPLAGFNWGAAIEIEGRERTNLGDGPSTFVAEVTPGYFPALHMDLLEGRLLTVQDAHNAPRALLVNQAFLRRYFPKKDAIGKRMRLSGEEWWTIVGVVADSKQMGLIAAVEPEIFLPLENWNAPVINLLLRTHNDPLALVSAVRTVVHELDPNLPLFDVAPMGALLAREVAAQRFNAALLSAFAAFALLLAALGIYGVMAYAVSQRTHEIGVRIALGAAPGNVLKMILARGLTLTLAGMAVGLSASFALTRFLGSLLYGVRPTDPLSFVAVSLTLLAVAFLACWLPARRAMRVDPMVALRYE
jgi:putative ABC transport system permease protein